MVSRGSSLKNSKLKLLEFRSRWLSVVSNKKINGEYGPVVHFDILNHVTSILARSCGVCNKIGIKMGRVSGLGKTLTMNSVTMAKLEPAPLKPNQISVSSVMKCVLHFYSKIKLKFFTKIFRVSQNFFVLPISSISRVNLDFIFRHCRSASVS